MIWNHSCQKRSVIKPILEYSCIHNITSPSSSSSLLSSTLALNAINLSPIAFITPQMVGSGKRLYAVEKLYQNNLDQNVLGRKNPHGPEYAAASTPKRLKDGFTNPFATRKKSNTTPLSSLATRASATAATNATIISATKSAYDGNTPFTPGKRRGRKKHTPTPQPPSSSTTTHSNQSAPSETLPPGLGSTV